MFDPGYYEDADLCFKIAATRKFVFYCPASTVIHIMNATSAGLWTPTELNQIVEINRQKFLLRWGDWLRARSAGGNLTPPSQNVRDGTALTNHGLSSAFDMAAIAE